MCKVGHGRDNRAVGIRARELGDELKSHDAKLGLGAVEFRYDTRSSFYLPNYEKWSDVPGLRLLVRCKQAPRDVSCCTTSGGRIVAGNRGGGERQEVLDGVVDCPDDCGGFSMTA